MPELNQNNFENGQSVVRPFNNQGNDLPYTFVGSHFLDDLEVNDILKDIALRIGDGRRLIIPIGLPQSGKSMFIASLIAYAFRKGGDNSCKFSNIVNPDLSGVNDVLRALDKKETMPTTTKNKITFIDLDMESSYRRVTAKVTLIDLAGEDIQTMINSFDQNVQNNAVDKIKSILLACAAQKAIFALLTPVYTGLGRSEDFDTQEDSEMKRFIDWLKNSQPNLYKLTQILLVVTKWDEEKEQLGTSQFLKNHRENLYGEFSGYRKSYGLLPFSVGSVVGETIVKIELRSPKNFWHTLYRWCTGRRVIPWWKQFF